MFSRLGRRDRPSHSTLQHFEGATLGVTLAARLTHTRARMHGWTLHALLVEARLVISRTKMFSGTHKRRSVVFFRLAT